MATLVRDRECWQCGHKWTAPVEMSRVTQRLSGEARVYCPKCNQPASISFPAYVKEEKDGTANAA